MARFMDYVWWGWVMLCIGPTPLWAEMVKGEGEMPLASHGLRQVTAQHLDVYQLRHEAVFQGEVVVTHDEATLSTDRLTLTCKPSDQKADTAVFCPVLTHIAAEGHVQLVAGGRVATSNRGWYDLAHQTIYLRDHVVLREPSHTLSGDVLTYHLATHQMHLTADPGASDDTNRVRAEGNATKKEGPEPASRVRAILYPGSEGEAVVQPALPAPAAKPMLTQKEPLS